MAFNTDNLMIEIKKLEQTIKKNEDSMNGLVAFELMKDLVDVDEPTLKFLGQIIVNAGQMKSTKTKAMMNTPISGNNPYVDKETGRPLKWRACYYLTTPHGCKWGDSCDFSHDEIQRKKDWQQVQKIKAQFNAQKY